MRKIKIGVIGVGRGRDMIDYCTSAENAELVAICDKWEQGLEQQKERFPDLPITYYTDYDEFLKHDMDAVVLANFANQHAPFAIKAMKAGKHVYSEVLPCQTMKEAVELIETVEETGKVYAYGENFCWMPAPFEMRNLYREGKIGEIEYAECEYIHNCEPIWPQLTYGDPNHWRNRMYSTYYCTHSLGPIIHMTGLRPVSVVGFEGANNERNLRTGAKSGQFGIEMVTLENGAVIKSIHGGLYLHSIWYCVYGSKGRMESAREDVDTSVRRGAYKLHVQADEYSGEYADRPVETSTPTHHHHEQAKDHNHFGADWYSMYNFVEKLRGNEEADIIDVYEAMDMFLPGMFAFRSILKGNAPMEIPNLRDKAVRDQYRNDTACTDPDVAGDMLMPTSSKGTPEIEPGVFKVMKEKWEKILSNRTPKE